jgi:class 3 adenylate cyclase
LPFALFFSVFFAPWVVQKPILCLVKPMYPELHYRWDWELKVTPEQLWPYIADTNRFNADNGLAHLVSKKRTPDGLGWLMSAKSYGFLPLEWEEEPYQWIYPQKYGTARHYKNGPVVYVRIAAELTPIPAGTHLTYEIKIQPRNWFGAYFMPYQTKKMTGPGYERNVRLYEQLILNRQTRLDLPSQVQLEPQADERIQQVQRQLQAQKIDGALLEKLLLFIRRGDDIEVSKIRPYALADQWGAERKAVLELCLLATRLGLLSFQWEILCPMCRGAGRNVADHLQEVNPNVHCDSCNIDYTANFERSVEITFRPSPIIRQVDLLEYCVAGPETTPHIVVQQYIPAAGRVVAPLVLQPGRYRLRAPQLAGGQYVLVQEKGQPTVELTASPAGWLDEEIQVAPQTVLQLVNNTAAPHLFIFERLAWTDQAVTAAEVTTLQKFRDLFATEALRPDQQFSVGSVAILFTDLVNSTRMYNEIGDAPAFGLVLNHFDVLKKAIDEEQGAIVKTIGDAVMAVFRRPVAAVRAITKAQMILSQGQEGNRPLLIKAGIHFGPCIAVTLNDRLDYFGSTVNMAARLEGFSKPNTVVITNPVRHDPEVVALLNQTDMPFSAEPFEAKLKGFDEGEVHLWRIAPKG